MTVFSPSMGVFDLPYMFTNYEDCYKLIDQQTRQVGYYTKEGTLVYQRAARHDELQPNIFKLNPAKTGTDDK